MDKQKVGYVRNGLHLLHKGEPIITFTRHDDSAHDYKIHNIKLSKKEMDRIGKFMKDSLYRYYGVKRKKKLRDEDVWSVS